MEKLLHTKEVIILSSIEVINKFGIQGWSTKEIAREAGITEGAIFRHFSTKKEILSEVLKFYSYYDTNIFESIRLKCLKPIEAIYFLTEHYTTYYENYPAITAITQNYDAFRCDENFADQVSGIFTQRLYFVKSLLEKAKEKGNIKADTNTDNLAIILIGTFRTICLQWRFENYEFSLKERVLSAVSTLLNTFCISE